MIRGRSRAERRWADKAARCRGLLVNSAVRTHEKDAFPCSHSLSQGPRPPAATNSRKLGIRGYNKNGLRLTNVDPKRRITKILHYHEARLPSGLAPCGWGGRPGRGKHKRHMEMRQGWSFFVAAKHVEHRVFGSTRQR